MPNQQHTPSEVIVFSQGATYTVDAEYAGLVTSRGYFDARNMRRRTMNKNDNATKRINGEEIKYPAINNSGFDIFKGSPTPTVIPFTYKCIYAVTVIGKLFEVWVDKAQVYSPFFRVNGIIVASSDRIPFTVDFGIQGHFNDTCVGGEVFLTDFNSSPQIYSIKDLYDNRGVELDSDLILNTPTAKYFDNFDLTQYVINQATPADHPVFIELNTSTPTVPTGQQIITIGAGGLKAGSYQYSIRYKNIDGDATQWSEPTPWIPVPLQVSSNASNYPWSRTFGAAPGSSTSIGALIRFRVTNLFNYDTVEVRRTKAITGASIETQGEAELIYTLDIEDDEISVVNIFDLNATGITLSQDVDINAMAVIDKAKTLRYFGKKLYLMNIKYGSRDVDNDVEFNDNPQTMLPISTNIGVMGHKDPWYATYMKTLMHRERYGWGVKFIDGFNARTFTKAVTGNSSPNPQYGGNYTNYLMPGRRNVAVATTGNVSYVQAADINNNILNTFEILNDANATAKTDIASFHNIVKLSNTSLEWPATSKVEQYAPLADPDDKKVGYLPFRPTGANDSSVISLDDIVNTGISSSVTYYPNYKPELYNQEFHTLGMRFAGLDKYPSYISAFTVQRTKAAGRVIAQGIAFYALSATEFDAFYNITKGLTKAKNKVWVYCPDLEAGLVNDTQLFDASNLSNIKLEVIAPNSFLSEVYTGASESLASDHSVDMITYVLGNENKPNNALTTLTTHVEFGRWRNNITANIPFKMKTANTPGNTLYGITSAVKLQTNTGRSSYWELTLDADIYAVNGAGGANKELDANVAEWTEPMYSINIVRNNAQIEENQNQQIYYNTGHYQKIVSIIGRSNGSNSQAFTLVDERFEDCCASNSVDDIYLYVKDSITGVESIWIDITLKSSVDISAILQAIANGTDYNNVLVKGVYTHSIQVVNGQNRFYTINFIAPGNVPISEQQYYVPKINDLIVVRYDVTKPIDVYGGDHVNGYGIFAPIDSPVPAGGISNQILAPFNSQLYPLFMAFPHYQYEINPRIYIPKDVSQGSTNKIQDSNNVRLKFIRQLICMFACTSKIHLGYSFNGTFPNHQFPITHYVMRPIRWKSSGSNSDYEQNGNIFQEYGTDYPDEIFNTKPDGWQYGGFRFIQSTFNTNIDYNKEQENFINVSKPKTGYVEQNHFCTRIHWSSTREVNEQNSPGLKTYPALYYRDINDNTGGITKAYSTLSGKGFNLYAFTNSGVCLLMTDKFIMRQVAGTDVSIVQAEGNQSIVQEEWLTLQHGIPLEMWRTFAEHNNVCWWANKNSVYRMQNDEIMDIGRMFYHKPLLTMLNKVNQGYLEDITGVYDIYHGEYWLSFSKRIFIIPPPEIGRTGPTSLWAYITPQVYNVPNLIYEIYPPYNRVFLPNVFWNNAPIWIINSTGSTLPVETRFKPITPVVTSLPPNTAASFTPAPNLINWILNSPVFTVDDDFRNELLQPEMRVWEDLHENPDKQGRWIGKYDYRFDKYSCINNITYGMRSGQTYQLDKGFIINNQQIQGEIDLYTTGGGQYQPISKEFWRIRINSNIKPTQVKIYQDADQLLIDDYICEISLPDDTLYLKDYDGYENYIPRQEIKKDRVDDRVQGRIMFAKILYNDNSEFFITNVIVKFKPLK
jgi:hypothetical protein